MESNKVMIATQVTLKKLFRGLLRHCLDPLILQQIKVVKIKLD